MSLQSPRAWRPLILLGFLLGIAFGLVMSWGIWPLQYYDTEPAALRPEQKAAYVTLTGLMYGIDRDLDRARVRLYALQDANIVARVRDMASEYIKHGDDPMAAYGLAMLAQALGTESSVLSDYLKRLTPSLLPSPTMTWTPFPPMPTASWTPIPSRTVTRVATPTPTLTRGEP